MLRLLISFTILSLASCSSGGGTQTQGWIFDLSDYVDEISKEYENRKATKKIEINGQSEVQEIEMNVLKEFGVLVRSDINILSKMDRYSADTLETSPDSYKMVYVARDPKLSTRKLEVEKSAGSVIRIFVQNQYKSLISSSDETIEWLPGRRYSIEKKETSMFREDVNLKIELALH